MQRRFNRKTRQDLTAIERKLERWELPHLRELAARQAEQIEQLQARLAEVERQWGQAEQDADHWRHEALELYYAEAETTGGRVGLTRSGALVALPGEASFQAGAH